MNDLALECQLFTRYLVGKRAEEELIERYRAANRELLKGSYSPKEQAVLSFSCTHPIALPFLDAASAFVAPHSLLRQKLLIMVALLETTPRFIDSFLVKPQSPIMVIAKLCWCGAVSAVEFVIGFCLFPFIRA